MGLGKTIQIIAFICHLYEKNLVGPFLIIGPLSTITNWKAEFNKFASKVPCVLYHGTVGERVLQKENVHNRYKLDGKQVYPVVITSYEISIKDKGFFFKYQWKYLIVDEGHRLKNYQSVLSRTLSLFPKVNSLLLTGTPLQNNLQELWSLLHFILPTVFDELGSFNEWLAVDDLNENSYKLIEKKNGTNMLSALHKVRVNLFFRIFGDWPNFPLFYKQNKLISAYSLNN
ncbi:hypothetical protein AAG570_008027 [Ranatra chinensis]|uniref:Helicase ATP-binding domain-containing protein n=1 Tax=Ranatra chinensis TaxID=642074 RepID=A0ABD0XTM3_9HEMI